MKRAHKEIRIPHDEIRDPAKVTQVNVRRFKERGLDVHHHEVDDLEDDHDRGERVLKVRGPITFVDLGRKGGRS